MIETEDEVPVAGPHAVVETSETFERIQDWWKEAADHTSDWRIQAREDYDFVAGEQWSQDDKALLEEQLRPVITFNRVGAVIDSVSGMEVGNRQEVRFIPREMGDVGVNEVLTGAVQWVRDQCDAEDEESDCFLDTIIAGMGWTETRMDYEEEAEGDIKIDRVDPLEMYWDPGAKKRNLSDARWVLRVRDIAREDAEEMFPDAEPEELNAKWADDGTEEGNQPHDAEEAPFYRNDQDPDFESDKVRVVHAQWWEKETVFRVRDETTGQTAEFPPDKFNKLAERAAAIGLPLKHIKTQRRKYFQAFIGSVVLLEEESPCQKGFTFRCVTGKRDRNRNTWYGLVRMMKDPQRWANKWLSQILHILNSNAKGGLLAEKTAVDNVRQFEESWADPSGITWLRDGAIAKGQIMPKPMTQYPAGLDRLMEIAVSSIRDVSGVNLEVLGAREAQQAASLEYQRRQAGMTILATMFDSLRRYRKEQGRILLYFIQNYLSDGRLVKIVGDEGAKYVPLVKDSNTVQYDVIVDDAPTSPNMKEQVWAALSQMIPMLLKTPLPAQVWAELIKYSPLPESITEKMAQAITAPNPVAEQQQQLGMEQMQAETDLTKAKAFREAAAAQSEGMKLEGEKLKAETARAKVASERGKARSDAVKLGMEAAAGRRDQQRVALEAADRVLKGKELQLKARQQAIDARQAEADRQMGYTQMAVKAKTDSEKAKAKPKA